MVRHLTTNVGCRTMFATHYHSLTDDFGQHPRVKLGHMVSTSPGPLPPKQPTRYMTMLGFRVCQGCLEESGKDGMPRVTFLYTYRTGACPTSHGINVARLAHLPEEVSLTFHATACFSWLRIAVSAVPGRSFRGLIKGAVNSMTPWSKPNQAPAKCPCCAAKLSAH